MGNPFASGSDCRRRLDLHCLAYLVLSQRERSAVHMADLRCMIYLVLNKISPDVIGGTVTVFKFSAWRVTDLRRIRDKCFARNLGLHKRPDA